MYPTVTMPAMLKIKEAARVFKVGTATLRRAVHTGKLRAYIPNSRDMLVKADEVQAWIESCRYRTNSREMPA